MLLAKARRVFNFERNLGMEFAGTFDQRAFGLWNLRVGNATVHRTGSGAFLVIEEADTFGALAGHDVIDVGSDRVVAGAIEFPWSAPGVDCVVRASRGTGPAVDTFFRN